MRFGVSIPISDPWLAGLVRSVEASALRHPASSDTPKTIQVESLPDGTMTLLYRRTSSTTGDLSIAGSRTRALFKTTDAVPLALAVRFAPGAASTFLGLPAHALTDRIVRLEEVWGADGGSLLHELLDADDARAALGVVVRALRSRAARTRAAPGARLTRRTVRLLEMHTGEMWPRVDDVARTLGVSSRHLRRVFLENVGIGPKEFTRSVRLQRAIALTGVDNWAEIASQAGYYDQAHLIDDFRDLVGVTPRVFARRDTVMDWPRRCKATEPKSCSAAR